MLSLFQILSAVSLLVFVWSIALGIVLALGKRREAGAGG